MSPAAPQYFQLVESFAPSPLDAATSTFFDSIIVSKAAVAICSCYHFLIKLHAGRLDGYIQEIRTIIPYRRHVS